ncbi:MAG TPA: 6-phosphogluconolactonase [Lentisphaeria bacterium]|nr:MAG: 6-phosphogluconolactonase [Lentisphaerae bacterium GWF2_38_69]HBM15837.1 6-phosphogluconolactonase [Lentisphaeria bacterium]
MKVSKFETIKELSHWSANYICKTADECIAKKGFFTLCLSGGSSPAMLYLLLATEYVSRMNWTKTYIFWSDERFVPHTDGNSNFHMAYDLLLSKCPIREANIFPTPVTGSPEEAAEQYEKTIRNFFWEKNHTDYKAIPSFDVILLGMGGDGHVASLFPGIPQLDEPRRLVLSVTAPFYAPSRDRITFTFPLINSAAHILLLVPGKEKSKLISQLINPDPNPNRKKLPAECLRHGDTTHLVIDSYYS